VTVYLDLDDLLLVAARAADGDVVVEDYGLLGSAEARPKTTVAGTEAYPDIHTKAAALCIPCAATTLWSMATSGWRGPPAKCFLASTASGWRPPRTTGLT